MKYLYDGGNLKISLNEELDMNSCRFFNSGKWAYYKRPRTGKKVKIHDNLIVQKKKKK